MVSQFAFNSTTQGPFYQCIAVSTSDDPTGSWCAYEFLVHQTKFNDYPKFGIWPAQNSYTMTAPQFNSNGGQGVWGFERDKMLACQTARFVYQDMVGHRPDPAADPPGRRRRADRPADGAPRADRHRQRQRRRVPGRPARHLERDDDVGLDPGDQRHARGRDPGRAVRPGPARCPGGGGVRTCIPQPGTSVKVDALPNRPMYRAAYRNYGSYQALAWDHTVDADAPSGIARGSAGTSSARRPATGRSRTRALRPGRRPLPLDGPAAMDTGRQPRRRLLDRQRDGPELSEPRVRGPARERRAEHARPGRGDRCTPARAPRRAPAAAGATTR